MFTNASTTSATTAPPSLPVLGCGKHRNPDRGACFMEYTSVLAGEPFSDSPRCVDAQLATVLRGANDTLSDGERSALVPLLGRAIGLVVESPAGRRPAGGLFGNRVRREEWRRRVLATGRLHRSVCERFRAALAESGITATQASRDIRVDRMFWDLMSEPIRVTTSKEYVTRLVERLELLHRCYDEALRDPELHLAAAPSAHGVLEDQAVPLDTGR